MMIFTHVLVGLLVGVIFSAALPGFLGAAVVAGGLGGLFPDLDMVFVHRKTLHFPVLFNVAGAIATGLAVWRPSVVSVPLAVGLSSAGVHSVMDALGGGKEMRPWLETDDRAVFNHVSNRWVPPRRLIYDGSKTDLVLSLSTGGFCLYALPTSYTLPVVALMLTATAYTLLRRWVTHQIPDEFGTFSAYIQHHLRALSQRLRSS